MNRGSCVRIPCSGRGHVEDSAANFVVSSFFGEMNYIQGILRICKYLPFVFHPIEDTNKHPELGQLR